MKRIILTLAVAALAASAAMAGPPIKAGSFKGGHQFKGNGYKGGHQAQFKKGFVPPAYKVPTTGGYFKHQNYHLHYGTKHHFGYAYRGFHHNHWSRVYFSPVHGCKLYFCPGTQVPYYWCAWDSCFYPVTYNKYGRFAF